jgi:hypothetical protein
MTVYGPGCHPQNIIWTEAKLRSIYYFVGDRLKRSWGPYTILWVTDRSINCHLARSAINYLLYHTQYMQICQTTCFCYCLSKTKNEFGQNPEENIILIGPVNILKYWPASLTKTNRENKNVKYNIYIYIYMT